ncbi:hypothetical protein NDU88_001604 [Pleurodeles waltl]|uniref:Uncharacterized protein n=1 Tax=Pleurodeles waltl TaxID=8319 RepID=A0AAV7TIA4_PLEWA|nr:hypothetical protein NDU88_001604 [Pleurodeles waltl]
MALKVTPKCPHSAYDGSPVKCPRCTSGTEGPREEEYFWGHALKGGGVIPSAEEDAGEREDEEVDDKQGDRGATKLTEKTQDRTVKHRNRVRR